MKLGELIVLASAVSADKSFFGGIPHDWIILDEIEDIPIREKMLEKQEKAQKNYLNIVPKYNGGKK